MTIVELQQRAKPISTLLDVFARKRTITTSFADVFQRLQRKDWLQADPKSGFSITELGQQRLNEELARSASMLSEFVEAAEVDQSFRQFLKGRKLDGGN